VSWGNLWIFFFRDSRQELRRLTIRRTYTGAAECAARRAFPSSRPALRLSARTSRPSRTPSKRRCCSNFCDALSAPCPALSVVVAYSLVEVAVGRAIFTALLCPTRTRDCVRLFSFPFVPVSALPWLSHGRQMVSDRERQRTAKPKIPGKLPIAPTSVAELERPEEAAGSSVSKSATVLSGHSSPQHTHSYYSHAAVCSIACSIARQSCFGDFFAVFRPPEAKNRVRDGKTRHVLEAALKSSQGRKLRLPAHSASACSQSRLEAL
jgi:hypothetical protein